MTRTLLVIGTAFLLVRTPVAEAQRDSAVTAHGDSVSLRLIDVDVRAAVEALGQYLDKPVVFGAVNGGKVTLQTPRPISRSAILPLLRTTLESQNMELVADSTGTYLVRAKVVTPPTPPPVPVTPEAALGPLQLYVIHLTHARAVDVAATVSALYGKASAFGELGANHPASTLSQQLGQTQASSYGAMQGGVPQTPAASSGNGGATGPGGTLSGETTIVPDQGTNSLLIRATPSDYDLIMTAVKQIDVRPLQVLIEMIVAEVRHDRSLSIGLSSNLPPHQLPNNPNVTVSGSTAGIGLGDLVLNVMGAGGIKDLDLQLSAAASHGDVSIVSRPAVIAANNETAQILVGSQRPFVEVSRSLPTDAASRDQVVQYKDVGTKLSVKPTISGDGYVMLEVTQEISQATSEVQFDAPVISTRSVQTRLLLKDGQSVVIGGLRDRQHEVTRTGVPFLSSLPLIGWLFGGEVRSTTGTELFLFITPRVLRNDDEVDSLTKPQQERARGAVKSSIIPNPKASGAK